MNEAKNILLNEMKKIINSYKIMGLFPYELYTLMYNKAINNNLKYDIDLHIKLLMSAQFSGRTLVSKTNSRGFESHCAHKINLDIKNFFYTFVVSINRNY